MSKPRCRKRGSRCLTGGTHAAHRISRLAAGLVPYLYVLPALLCILIRVYRPLLGTVQLSFYQWNLIPTTPKVAVGWDNYQNVLTLPEMGSAARNTLLYVGGMIPFSIMPLAIALFVSDIQGRARSMYRVLVFAPVLVAPVVVGIVWRRMLEPHAGNRESDAQRVAGHRPHPLPRFPGPRTLDHRRYHRLETARLQRPAVLREPHEHQPRLHRRRPPRRSAPFAGDRDIILPLLSPTDSLHPAADRAFLAQWTFSPINVLTQGGPLDSSTNIYYLLSGSSDSATSTSASARPQRSSSLLTFGLIAFVGTRIMDRFSFYDA